MENFRPGRRFVLQGSASALAVALLGGAAAAQASAWERFAPARTLIGKATPVPGLTLDLPLVAEDGASVPITVHAERSADDPVQSLHLFATRNPTHEIAEYQLVPEVRLHFTTRVRLNESQSVIAIARTRKGEVLVASREVRVTESGCLARSDSHDGRDEMRARVRVSGGAAAPIEVLALITHPMETGLREGANGKILPQRIIRSFEATLDGVPLLKATLYRSLAANPYLRFFITPPSGAAQLTLTWTEDTGRTIEFVADLRAA